MQVYKIACHMKSRDTDNKTWSYRMRDPPLERAMVPLLTNPPELSGATTGQRRCCSSAQAVCHHDEHVSSAKVWR
jgi:hypothetical protein